MHILPYKVTVTELVSLCEQCRSKNEGLKEMQTLAIARFSLPGEAQFPLNAMYTKPSNRNEEGMMMMMVVVLVVVTIPLALSMIVIITNAGK